VLVNLSNAVGAPPALLSGVHLPIRFSRGVQAWDGSWTQSPVSSFFPVPCWGLYLNDPNARPGEPPSVDLCATPDGAPAPIVSAALTEWGIDVAFAQSPPATVLCAGCWLASPLSADGAALPSFALQHSTYGRLDVETAGVTPPLCAAAAKAGDPLPGAPPPLPAPGIERHPACSPWSSKGQPKCAPADAVAALALTLTSSFVADGRELRLRPVLRNGGPNTISLFGLSFSVAFPMALAADLASSPPRGASDFSVECFWAAVSTSSGVQVFGQRPACEYLSAAVTASGVSVTFLGGELCAGCSLAGASGASDAMFNVKAVSYEPLATVPAPAVRAGVGALGCAPPAGPPNLCVS
jgi:hypothetical protein